MYRLLEQFNSTSQSIEQQTNFQQIFILNSNNIIFFTLTCLGNIVYRIAWWGVVRMNIVSPTIARFAVREYYY